MVWLKKFEYDKLEGKWLIIRISLLLSLGTKDLNIKDLSET